MKRLSTTDKLFLDPVQNVFEAPEVLVVIRYVYGAGNRDFLILRDMTEFDSLLGALRCRDSVIVMRSFKKIKDGRVDQAFLEGALEKYSEGTSWIIVGEDNFEHTADWAYAESRDELTEELQDRMGNHVIIVAEPDYINDDDSISAYVPDEDGIVRPGAY
jgi:hypothetical protein